MTGTSTEVRDTSTLGLQADSPATHNADLRRRAILAPAGSDAWPSQSQDVRDEHLRGALVGRVGGGEELGHVAFLGDSAEAEVSAEKCDRDQLVEADRYRRAGHGEDWGRAPP